MLFVKLLKVWSLMACLVFVGQAFAANCAANYVAPENPVWDGTSIQEPCQDPVDKYYVIDNAKKLAWYAKNYDKGNAKLTADIDLGDKLWTPIAAGQGNAKYSKTFDGNGHVIKNMYINGTELAQIDKNYAQNLGFIGTLGNADSKKPGGTVKNVIFENVDIQASTNAGDILGRDDSQISVGVVVGWMAENDSNFVVNCVAASGTIRTTGNGQGVGGIVGNAKKGTISNCLSLVEIHTSGSLAYVGGIIGITKTNVSVSSCVYAGPGLVNTGTDGLTGGVTGNVYSGTITTENNYFEGGDIAGVGGSSCQKNCTPKVTTAGLIDSAKANAQKVDETNADDVACALNGKDENGSCKEEPWSLGQTGLSLNGYGADGYKIVFKANGGVFANGKNTTNKFLQAGMTITADEVVSPSRENFSFAGWARTNNATEVAENLGVVSGKDTIFAVWTPVYTITFNVAPGVFPESGESEETKQVASGDVITVEGLGALPSSRCKAYATEDECETWSYFTGWALTEGASESDSVSLDTVAASDELVLYAVWTDVETYTVTYNANLHGRTTVDYVRVGAGDTVAVPTDPIADTGYVFDGWFTDAEGVNPYQFAKQINESIILYAKWALDTFTVAYEMNGVSNAGENPVFYTIETPTFALAAPADSVGFVFEGWFYDANFTNPASQVIQGTTGDKTFYAKWTKKTYRIMYLADNNSQGAITDQFKEHGKPFTLDTAGYFNRKGYAQTGWAIDTNGAKVYDFRAIYEENAALTLYPSWSDPIVYTITYVCDVCTETNPSKPRTYTVNNTSNGNYTLYNPSFSSSEYEFVGWFWDEAYTKRTTNIPKGMVGDTVLYGKMLKKYSITYELNGGTKANNRVYYTSETETFTLEDATGREGFTFAGWYDNDKFTGEPVTEIPLGSSGDKTFYAKWVPETVVTQYGAVTITETNTKVDGELVTTRSAVINGAYTGKGTIDFPTDVTVNSVEFSRSFTVNTMSTLMLPFSIDTSKVSGGKIYRFKRVEENEEGSWKVVIGRIYTEQVGANTPYLVLPTAETMTFEGAVTLNTTTAPIETLVNGDWEYKGLYTYTNFDTVEVDFKKYGFRGQERDGMRVGSFEKIGANVTCHPLRGYLVKKQADAPAKSANARFGRNHFLPDVIDIEIEDENGIVVETGKLNTVTGEVRMDRWFDLKGRRLNSKPSVKGTYYKNGKKVIIK